MSAKLSALGAVFYSLSKMRRASIMNPSSTLVLFLTEVLRYLILWVVHHSCTSESLTRRSRSLLLPRSMMTALSALSRHRSYHCSLMFLKEDSRERSKTMSTPWQPLK